MLLLTQASRDRARRPVPKAPVPRSDRVFLSHSQPPKHKDQRSPTDGSECPSIHNFPGMPGHGGVRGSRTASSQRRQGLFTFEALKAVRRAVVQCSRALDLSLGEVRKLEGEVGAGRDRVRHTLPRRGLGLGARSGSQGHQPQRGSAPRSSAPSALDQRSIHREIPDGVVSIFKRHSRMPSRSPSRRRPSSS